MNLKFGFTLLGTSCVVVSLPTPFALGQPSVSWC